MFNNHGLPADLINKVKSISQKGIYESIENLDTIASIISENSKFEFDFIKKLISQKITPGKKTYDLRFICSESESNKIKNSLSEKFENSNVFFKSDGTCFVTIIK
jgi:hypothetical protein